MIFTETNLCGCGTKVDAFKTAIKVMDDMIDKNCPMWAMQVTSCLAQISFLVAAAVARGKPDDPENTKFHAQIAVELNNAAKGDPECDRMLAELMQKLSSISTMVDLMPESSDLDELLKKILGGEDK